MIDAQCTRELSRARSLDFPIGEKKTKSFASKALLLLSLPQGYRNHYEKLLHERL